MQLLFTLIDWIHEKDLKVFFLDLSMLCSVKFQKNFEYSFCNKLLMEKVIEVVESLKLFNKFFKSTRKWPLDNALSPKQNAHTLVRTHVFPYALILNRNFLSANRFEHENFTLKLTIRIAYIVSGIVLISPF